MASKRKEFAFHLNGLQVLKLQVINIDINLGLDNKFIVLSLRL